jgi:hypothetical protein
MTGCHSTSPGHDRRHGSGPRGTSAAAPASPSSGPRPTGAQQPDPGSLAAGAPHPDPSASGPLVGERSRSPPEGSAGIPSPPPHQAQRLPAESRSTVRPRAVASDWNQALAARSSSVQARRVQPPAGSRPIAASRPKHPSNSSRSRSVLPLMPLPPLDPPSEDESATRGGPRSSGPPRPTARPAGAGRSGPGPSSAGPRPAGPTAARWWSRRSGPPPTASRRPGPWRCRYTAGPRP